MKKLLFFVVLAGLALGCNAVTGKKGSGNAKTETRGLTGFKEIEANGALDLDIGFGSEYGVKIEADDNLLQDITTEVKGDKLVIGTSERINPKTRISIKIAMPELSRLDVNGASTGNITGLKGDKFDLALNGASRLKISGEVHELKARASGASSIDAEGLKAENAEVDSNGASKITVNATGDLKADASGASSVTYVGEPRSLKQSSAGASSVKKK
jgi:Putative auto-transporter adhesin, head GIN domain